MSSLRPSVRTAYNVKRSYKPAILAPQKEPVATKVVSESSQPKATQEVKECKEESTSRM
jgi:hypothetical protein